MPFSLCLVAAVSAGCASETISETEDLRASQTQPVCQHSSASKVLEDVENLCACLVEEVSQILEQSCAVSMGPEMLGRVTQMMYEDCSHNLNACEASLDDLEACSQAAAVEFAEACSVGFPEACTKLATAPGCAFYVGCPAGFHVTTVDGVSSCVDDASPG